MKRSIFTLLLVSAAIFAFGQAASDTTRKADSTKNGDFSIHIGGGPWGNDSKHQNNGHYPKGFIGLTFARFDLGFERPIDNGSFTLRPQNQFLSYNPWKTSTVGFDVFQMGVRFSSHFKMFVSGGFDWTLIRLNNDITMLKDQPALTYKQDSIPFSKNRFSASYLRIPLSFEFRTDADRHGNRWHFVVGPEGEFLLGGMVKQISQQFGKQKFYNSYHFNQFEYGGFARVGYGDFGLFAKYYANDMFENSPAQNGLRNFSFGIMLGF